MAKLDLFKARLGDIEASIQTLDFYSTTDSDNVRHYNPGHFTAFYVKSLSLLTDLVGEKHPFYQQFVHRCVSARYQYVEAGKAIISSVKEALNNGWLNDLAGIVSAEVFSDFMDMADHLLTEGYKDPAAVMIGSVLEEHLRRVAQNNGVDTYVIKDGKPVPKRADLLNADLAKALVYNALDQKQVTAWLDLRNKAAHGKYVEYTKEQVDLMYQGVLNFIGRVN
ncbi:hypothetical protein ACAW74_25970 [Fibrella sp. WM1]|uniref:hypothetical protein n=1 Tax=Fibrella musci TaxID=3242485 RepID=UPI00352042FA